MTCARTLRSNTVDWKNKLGRYNDLNAGSASSGGKSVSQFLGERAVRKLVVNGDLVVANTVLPEQSGGCSSTTGGFALAFCPDTGGLGCRTSSVFDIHNGGDFDNFVNKSRVAGVSFGKLTPMDAAFLGSRMYSQLSDGSLSIITANLSKKLIGKRVSWRRFPRINDQ